MKLKGENRGYLWEYDPTHPMAMKHGMVYIHRKVAYEVFGNAVIGFHVHHKDGNKKNNSPENLEILAPELHVSLHKASVAVIRHCSYCRKEIPVTHKRRRNRMHLYCNPSCADSSLLGPNPHGKYKILWPSIDELLEITKEVGFMEAGRRLGVSDNAIRNHMRKLMRD